MAASLDASQSGRRWQAFYFWLKALSLLRENSEIQTVAFEDGPKAFDDVVVTFRPGHERLDYNGRKVHRDHYQCKWQVIGKGIGWADLIDPRSINATSVSLLERLRDAIETAEDSDRFHLATTASLHTGDPLIGLIGNSEREFQINRLFDGTGPTGKMGAIRNAWCDHLGVSEETLSKMLDKFRLRAGSPPIDELIENLNFSLSAAGLKPIDRSKSAATYDEVIWRWYGQGHRKFDITLLESLCRQEDLFLSVPKPLSIGIRTFVHDFDDLALRTDRLLDLTGHFNGRQVRNIDDWQYQIGPRINSFLTAAARQSDHLQIALDAHVSIAFAAGRTLSIKSGKLIDLEQRTGAKRMWTLCPDQMSPVEHGCSIVAQTDSATSDIVIDVSIARDVSEGVALDLQKKGLQHASRISVRPTDGPSPGFVSGPAHAYAISQAVVDKCTDILRKAGSCCRVHLYFAGPNALAFCLAQLSVPIRDLTVYEWDFEQSTHRGYVAGLRFNV
ncbi:SAVED domain-containing protein [Hyphococcus sp.]|uniref:SAVED domain-containing protein n=1 Tax=Hyphococcus sp. TaxID=2038636 RepID=UPI003CCBED72